MVSIEYLCFLLTSFINNYTYTMLAQYLVSLVATNLRKSKKNSVKAVNSPQDILCPFFSGKLMYRFPKISFSTMHQAQLCS